MGSGHEPNHDQQDDEEEVEPTEEIVDDDVGQSIETTPACIDGVADEGTPSNATDERHGRSHSETPSIKSPHKPTRGRGEAARRLTRSPGTSGEREGQQHEAAGPSTRAALGTIEEGTT